MFTKFSSKYIDVHYCRICSEITNLFFFLIGDLMEIGLRSAAFLPLISLKKGLKFASHNVTHGTQKYTCVKHTKLNRLERGHFEVFGIRQQVLTKSIIMKMSASQSSFRKYLTSEQHMSFLTIFWQRILY